MKKTSIFILLFMMMALPSCELESEMYDVINPTMFPKTAADADALVTGSCYSVFRASWGGVFCGTNGIQLTNDLLSDFGENTERGIDITLYGRWTASYHWAFEDFLRYWAFVKNISSMMLTIDRIKAIDMNETHKNRLIAEVQCGIGLLTYTLYDFYGPLPLPDLETLKNPLEEKIFPRATEEEMQTFIETNLLEAVNAPELPDVYKKGDAGLGRFSKGIAHFLLLKYYMLIGQWDKAEAEGRELLDPKYGYDLVPRYKDIFSMANEKNEETIFSYICLDGQDYFSENEYVNIIVPPDYPSPNNGRNAWNRLRLSWWFVHTFDPDDQRGHAPCLITEYVGTSGIVHNETADQRGEGFLKYGALPFKYEFDPTTSGADSQIDYIFFRYADALTLLAEAIVRNNDQVTQEAIGLLNRVRVRAFGGDQSKAYTSFRNVNDFLDKLLEERGHELYWEGCRRTDLIRHGKYVEQMIFKAQGMGSISLVNENYVRFPLPQSVIDEGKGIILQNPGY
jgi:hypothetical protein